MYDDAEPDVRLIAAKSKVAPLIKQTIPRLELMEAGILARLVKSIQSNLPFPTTNWFWSDSVTTLAWIRNYRPWKLFIRNRANQIRGLTNIENWRHCPGELNPADLPTRGISGKQLVDNELWWQDPVF